MPASKAHTVTLQRRHNGHDSVSNHRCLDCLFNRLFRRRSKKTSKLCVTGLCEGNSPVTSEVPSQRASNAEIFPFDDVVMSKQRSMYHPRFQAQNDIDGILPKGPYPPCLRMADRALLAGYPRHAITLASSWPVLCQAITWTNIDSSPIVLFHNYFFP